MKENIKTVESAEETKSWFFEKMNKPLAILTNKKREETK